MLNVIVEQQLGIQSVNRVAILQKLRSVPVALHWGRGWAQSTTFGWSVCLSICPGTPLISTQILYILLYSFPLCIFQSNQVNILTNSTHVRYPYQPMQGIVAYLVRAMPCETLPRTKNLTQFEKRCQLQSCTAVM